MNQETKNKPEVKEKVIAEEKKVDVVKNIAIIRIRGQIGLKQTVKDTMTMLRLYRKNYCVVVKSTPSIMGMIKKAKDYITWGEIDDDTLKLLKEKRGEKTKNKKGEEVDKKYFRLAPPKGGFERKGIKIPFTKGGALGERKEKINDLIKKMI